MEHAYILQALTTAAGAAMAGGLIGWCTFGLAATVRRLLHPVGQSPHAMAVSH